MKILKCPACKQFVHFDAAPRVEKCWNCGSTTDFSRIKKPEEKLLICLDRTLGSLPFPDLGAPSFLVTSKAGVVLALPIAIMMLLICNSFNISIVRNLADSFASHRIPADYDGQTGME